VVCVNNLCWNSGLWVPEFQAAGFKVIRGADSKDPKTLEHMASLFRQFEFVTTNAYGSHLAYASFFGAKVSIFGPYFELSGESLQNIPFYVDNPHLIPLAIASSSEETVRKYYPAFFRTPAEATDQTDWGRRAVGWDQRVSPSEMRKLFGWTLRDRVQERITGRIKKLETPKTRPKAEDMELKRLKAMTTFEPGHAELFGRKFEFIDASTYLKMFDKHFKRQLYHFKASTERPLIIDGGANIGLSVLFFKCLYPAARVIASEADPAIAEVLERNCGTYELPDVQVVPKALWKCEDLVPFLQEGSLWGRFSNTANGAQVRSVPACRLGDFLNERVDLLKLDIEGAETEVLPDCAQQLHNVENIILEHHSFSNKPQKLDLVVNLLTEAGFRLYIEPAAQAKRPLFQRQFTSGMDVQMTIFGFRP
jgi:FkbM family methyltransferase